MAMLDFASGAVALSTHIRQLIRAWNGDSGQGQPLNLYGTSLPSDYVVHVKNLDDTNGQIFLAERSDGTDMLKVTKDGVRFSPDGSTEGLVPASLTGTETLTNKTFDHTSNCGWVKLAATTLSGTAASFDFSSISGSYKHLQLRIHARGDAVAAEHALRLRFNNDSGSNYDSMIWYAAGGSTSTSQGTGATDASAGICPCASAGASLFATTVIEIDSYAATAANKTFRSSTAMKKGTGGSDLVFYQTAGFWRSSSAITRVTVYPFSGNLVADSSATLYGLVG